jgi:hypothetical protein
MSKEVEEERGGVQEGWPASEGIYIISRQP